MGQPFPPRVYPPCDEPDEGWPPPEPVCLGVGSVTDLAAGDDEEPIGVLYLPDGTEHAVWAEDEEPDFPFGFVGGN